MRTRNPIPYPKALTQHVRHGDHITMLVQSCLSRDSSGGLCESQELILSKQCCKLSISIWAVSVKTTTINDTRCIPGEKFGGGGDKRDGYQKTFSSEGNSFSFAVRLDFPGVIWASTRSFLECCSL